VVACLWEEGELVTERQNQHYVNLALIVQMATATTSMGATKEIHKEFGKFIQRLAGEA